jgi:hypothetical protein
MSALYLLPMILCLHFEIAALEYLRKAFYFLSLISCYCFIFERLLQSVPPLTPLITFLASFPSMYLNKTKASHKSHSHLPTNLFHARFQKLPKIHRFQRHQEVRSCSLMVNETQNLGNQDQRLSSQIFRRGREKNVRSFLTVSLQE